MDVFARLQLNWKWEGISGNKLSLPETTLRGCSYENVFLKYAANLQENTHAEV